MEEIELKNIDEQTKEVQKKKSTVRLFWLFVALDVILVGAIIYLIIAIFLHYFG